MKEAFGDPEFIKESIKGAEVVLSGFAPMTASVMDADPALKVIGIARGGPVNVDAAAATARGVMLIGTVGRNAISVADQTMGFILSESRHIARHSMALKTGTYFTDVAEDGSRKYLEQYAFQELEGKTLGLIGFGEVGRRVAQEGARLRHERAGLRPLHHCRGASQGWLRQDRAGAPTEDIRLHLHTREAHA